MSGNNDETLHPSPPHESLDYDMMSEDKGEFDGGDVMTVRLGNLVMTHWVMKTQ